MSSPCSRCGYEVPDNVEFCPVDRHFHGYPNVKLAARERSDLATRVATASATGEAGEVNAIRAMANEASAVVNVDVEFAFSFLTRDRNLYATYRKQIEAGIRLPAAPVLDQERSAAESRLFGSGSDITYAALGRKGQGLRSYGILGLRLKEDAIRDRASLLEENSYAFCKRHPANLPAGYRAVWADRADLAVAKIAPVATAGMEAAALQSMLLFSEGNRDTDSFIEVHVWGGFSPLSIEAIEVQGTPRNDDERDLLRLAEARAGRAGIQWIRQ